MMIFQNVFACNENLFEPELCFLLWPTARSGAQKKTHLPMLKNGPDGTKSAQCKICALSGDDVATNSGKRVSERGSQCFLERSKTTQPWSGESIMRSENCEARLCISVRHKLTFSDSF